MKNKKILVVAAHPDDDLLGCGGTIIKYSKYSDISVVYLGKGLEARYPDKIKAMKKLLKEHMDAMKRANKILGINKIICLDFPDNQFDSVPLLHIIQQLEPVITDIKPEIIFTHTKNDLNIDHRMTLQAVLTATRPLNAPFVKQIYSFEVPSSTEWSFGNLTEKFCPNCFIDISKEIKEKIRALKEYKNEIRNYPHPRSEEYLIANAKRWGVQAGLWYAEAFEIIRMSIA